MNITTTVHINRPVEQVFTYTSNPEKYVEWRPGFEEAKVTSSMPLRVGSTFCMTARFLGRRMEINAEFTEFQPNKLYAFKTTSGPVKSEGIVKFEPVNGGTQITMNAETKYGGLLRFAEPLLRGLSYKNLENQMQYLKAVLEGQS
jgi:carbon monoxide dehydrogenase subunit G